MRSSWILSLTTALALLTTLPAAAQDAQIDRQVLKSGVEIIRVTIRVNGRNGRPPRTLTKDDFTIRENGVTQTVSVYHAEAESPTTVRHEIGFSSSTPASVVRRKVEISVRGFRKKLRGEYSQKGAGPGPPGRAQG